MFVAASSRCFSDLPLDAALLQLVELEYSAVEIMIHETDGHLKPSEVLADPERAVHALPPDPPPDARGPERRHRSPRARLLPPIRRLLPAGEGHQGGDDHGPVGRTGHAVQRRSGTAADAGRPWRRSEGSASGC